MSYLLLQVHDDDDVERCVAGKEQRCHGYVVRPRSVHRHPLIASVGPLDVPGRSNRGDAHAPVHIGDRCDVGPGVEFITGTHAVGGPPRRAGEGTARPIDVEDGCWIGARATILPGVEIGDGCVVAAGSVVTDDCEPDGLYGGIPARRIRELS